MHCEAEIAAPMRKRRLGSSGRLLMALSDLAGGKGRIAHHGERNWASVTFAGTRHTVVMEFHGETAISAGECFIAFLPEHEFTIPGHLVADAAITQVDHRLDPPVLSVSCELLLLEDG